MKNVFSALNLRSKRCKVGTQRAIGVNPPNEALLFVICSPVGPYYPDGFKPVALYGTSEYIRAAPGGKSCPELRFAYTNLHLDT